MRSTARRRERAARLLGAVAARHVGHHRRHDEPEHEELREGLVRREDAAVGLGEARGDRERMARAKPDDLDEDTEGHEHPHDDEPEGSAVLPNGEARAHPAELRGL
jgi:hypothetical protein